MRFKARITSLHISNEYLSISDENSGPSRLTSSISLARFVSFWFLDFFSSSVFLRLFDGVLWLYIQTHLSQSIWNTLYLRFRFLRYFSLALMFPLSTYMTLSLRFSKLRKWNQKKSDRHELKAVNYRWKSGGSHGGSLWRACRRLLSGLGGWSSRRNHLWTVRHLSSTSCYHFRQTSHIDGQCLDTAREQPATYHATTTQKQESFYRKHLATAHYTGSYICEYLGKNVLLSH